MPTSRPRGFGDVAGDRASEKRSFSVGQLAHELNSLLDGSMRSIRLAERKLGERPDDAERNEILLRLQTAQRAMGDIAVMLERAMSDGLSDVNILSMDRSLGEETRFVLAALGAMAERANVELSASIAQEAELLPAGALGALLMNGVRNAIEASVMDGGEEAAVRIELSVIGGSELVIRISDTGPGVRVSTGDDSMENETPPAVTGHGLGLAICRAITADLGGRMELSDGPVRGAVFLIRIPLGSVKRT